MRTTVAALGAITILFVGLTGVSESAQQVKPTLNSTTANQTYNMSVGVFGGVSEGTATALPWFGVAAIVLVALGLLVVAGKSGGR